MVKYYPVSYVLSKITIRVVLIPLLLFCAGSGCVIYFADKNNASPFIWISGLILTWILPFIVGSYLYNKWRIWAYGQVDDLFELIRRADSGFGSKLRVVPGKWAVISAEDREKINRILSERVRHNRVVVDTEDDVTVPEETIVQGSKKHYLGLFAFGILVIPFFAYIRYEKAGRFVIDGAAWFSVAVFVPVALYGLFKFFSPTVKFTFSTMGFWMPKKGFFPWNTIDKIYIEYDDLLKDVHSNQHRKEYLVVSLAAIPGTSGEASINILLKDNNLSPAETERRIKVCLARYNKNAITKLTFGKKTV
ncbi:hypothetical protein [Niabella sp.]|uniref:hypothetical protein n=1 Tax=Niabella sp. TaxID=1962976 RepID=UPI00262C9B12|nr:hypothetical protein [Niabella sp.]